MDETKKMMDEELGEVNGGNLAMCGGLFDTLPSDSSFTCKYCGSVIKSSDVIVKDGKRYCPKCKTQYSGEIVTRDIEDYDVEHNLIKGALF